MAFYLGIDAGGTSTRCVVGDEQGVLAQANGPSSKIARVGPEAARQALQAVIADVCASARVNPRQVSQSCIGMAGASHAEVVRAARTWAAEVLAGRIEVVGDMVVAFEAAFGGGPGIVLIAGTGSICFGQNEKGETARAGGRGSEFSDEGSADWIGRMAVQAIRPDHNGPLARAVTEAWKLGAENEIESRVRSTPVPDFAALFPAVQKAAAAGDQVASDVLHRAGQELAKLAVQVIHELWPKPQRLRAAMTGGVLQNSAFVRHTFVTGARSNLEPAGYGIAVSFGAGEPVMGALSLARKMGMVSAKETAD